MTAENHPRPLDAATLLESPRSDDPLATTDVREQQRSGVRFHPLRLHAQGGLGRVFVASDAELNREVALKEIQPHYAHDDLARARFTVEAEITGRLEHPGIVPVYGLGTYCDGRPYYAMRLIRGESLKEAIERYHDRQRSETMSAGERAVELRQLLGRFVDVCHAVQYAHDRGVLHRDLKPANVMLGNYGETLVVDWGIAKAEGRSAAEDASLGEMPLVPASGSGLQPTEMGTMVGTLQYMSPEQAIGRLDLIGPATDVFALGATLYHLLTGQAPYQSQSREELVAAVRDARFPPPRQVKPVIPAPLESICLRALAGDPSERYASAGELLQEVERWLSEEPVVAHRESFAERMNRWRRKHPNVVSGVRAALAIGIVALCLGALGMQGMNRKLALTNAELEQACHMAYDAMREANVERERTRETIRFLATTLGKLDSGEDGRQLTAATLLSRATWQAETELQTDPELKSRVLEILTTAMQGLGLAEDALALHQRALEDARRRFDPQHPQVVDSVNDLAHAYLATGRQQEAIALLEAHAAARDEPTTEPTVTLVANRQMRGDEPQHPLFDELQRHRERPDQVLHNLADPLTTLDQHAETHLAKGQWDQAFPLKEAALRICSAQQGRHSAAAAARMSELARLYIHAGCLARGEELAAEAMAIQAKLLGEQGSD